MHRTNHFFLINIRSFENAIEIIEHFCQVLGMTLNKNKLERILLGTLKTDTINYMILISPMHQWNA
jgi:hypothetical protein